MLSPMMAFMRMEHLFRKMKCRPIKDGTEQFFFCLANLHAHENILCGKYIRRMRKKTPTTLFLIHKKRKQGALRAPAILKNRLKATLSSGFVFSS